MKVETLRLNPKFMKGSDSPIIPMKKRLVRELRMTDKILQQLIAYASETRHAILTGGQVTHMSLDDIDEARCQRQINLDLLAEMNNAG